MSENETKKSATERLEDLENMMAQVGQALSSLEPMTRDLLQIKDALKLLNNKLNAVARAASEGKLPTDEVVSGFMTESNAQELKGKVDQMVSNGLLAATDTVAKDSFVVINESDASGTIVNPRMQFLLSALQHPEVKGKLEGAKIGDNIKVGDQGASINVLEAYNVVPPKAPESSVTEAPAASESDNESLTSSSVPAEATV